MALDQYLPLFSLLALVFLFAGPELPRVGAPGPEAADRGEGSAVRVRDRARDRAGRAVPGEVLPGRDGVHRPRRRDHLPLSLHHGPQGSRRLRARHDGRVPARGARAVRLPPLHRCGRVGPGAPSRGARGYPGARAPPVRPAATASTRTHPGPSQWRRPPDGPRGRPAQLPDRATRGPREVGPPQLGVAGHLRPRVLRHGDDGQSVRRTTTPPASGWRCSGPAPARPTS